MIIYSEQNKEDFLTIISRYQENAIGFWEEHRKLVYLLIIAGFVDFVSTVYFMQNYGIDKEVHPLIRYLAYECGPITGTLIGKFAQISMGTLAIVYIRQHAKLILSIAAVMYSWAAVTNFISFLPGLFV